MSRKHFHNPWPHEEQGVLDIFKWKFKIGPQESPRIPDAGNAAPGFQKIAAHQIAKPPEDGWRICWLGHASFLVQGCGLSILIDPVFAEYCSPVPIRALRRKIPTPCALTDLPRIDIVLLTHSHYDHLDLSTLRALPGAPRMIIAEGHAAWLAKKLGRPTEELPWHAHLALSEDVKVSATPAQHFTSRTPFDRNLGHWCGWLLEGAGCKIWHAGDSAYCPAFIDIGHRYESIDFAMIPIGAYQPRRVMKTMHMDPEEAVQAFQDARCRRAIGMHWGTFELTDEPLHEPPLLLDRALEAKAIPAGRFTTENVGALISVSNR